MEEDNCEYCRMCKKIRPVYRDKTCTIVENKDGYVMVLGRHSKASSLDKHLMKAVVDYLFDGGQTVRIEDSHEHWLIAGAKYLGAGG